MLKKTKKPELHAIRSSSFFHFLFDSG